METFGGMKLETKMVVRAIAASPRFYLGLNLKQRMFPRSSVSVTSK